MPDISMCRNFQCTLKETCYRYKAEPNPYRQAYADFQQDIEGNCDYYWNMASTQTKKIKKDET